MTIEKLVSFHIEKQFPAIYREDGKELVQFVKEYYKFLETAENQSIYNGRRMFEYRDIDTTLERMLIFFKNKYLSELPFNDETIRVVVKNILGLYRRKGTEDGLKLFFRLFYDEDIKVYYPARDILKPSDSEWKTGNYLEIKPNNGVFTSNRTNKKYTYRDIIGKTIFGNASKSIAIVDKINLIEINKSLLPIIFISDLTGSFITNESIISNIDGLAIEFGRIKGSLSSIDVNVNDIDAALDNEIGEEVTFRTSRNTFGGSGIVTNVTENFTGIVQYEVADGGWGYTIDSTNLYVSNQIIFLNNENRIFNPIERLEDEFGDSATVIGQSTFSLGIRSANNVSFTANSTLYTTERSALERVAIVNEDSLSSVMTLAEAIVAASLNIEPEKTRFEAIVSGSRMLGDINNSGSITTNDSLELQKYLNGEQTNQTIIDYIEGEFKDFLNANQATYFEYPAIKVPFQSIVERNDTSPGDLYPETEDTNDVKVAQLTNTETVSLIFDKIGDFLNVSLDSSNYNDTPPALNPMSGNTDPVTIATPLDEAFDLSPTELGTIVSFENVNPGIDYVNDVFAVAYDTRVVASERREQLVSLENIPATLNVGDELTQGGIRAKVTRIIDSTIAIRPYSYYGFNSSSPIFFGSTELDVISISTDFNSKPAGFNAIINSSTEFGIGKIQNISVTDSGYGFVNGETIDILNKNGQLVSRGVAVTSGVGSTGGFWSTLNSHLNGYTSTLSQNGIDIYFDAGKKIHDSNFYQEYSYEILSTTNIKEYERPLKEITHVAGTKVFGKFNFEGKISSPVSISTIIDADIV